MPKPSADVGPKPNWRSEGLPQLEVDRIVELILSQPLSAKSDGMECCTGAGGELEIDPFSDKTELRLGEATPDASGLDGRVESQPSLLAISADSSIARCQMQYSA
jgi:hypothetical protein